MIVSRILPGEDLKTGIQDLIDDKGLKSGIIICMVGSISRAVLRMANGEKKIFNGPFEIVSSEGTCAGNGVHIHIAIADEEGAVYGGHLLEGCNVHTTAEIGIIESKIIYKRIHDPKTGYRELCVEDEH
jgi:predicted DNA-binding protein with PD1-like motif